MSRSQILYKHTIIDMVLLEMGLLITFHISVFTFGVKLLDEKSILAKQINNSIYVSSSWYNDSLWLIYMEMMYMM